MFHRATSFRRKRQDSTCAAVNELPLALEMPMGSAGKIIQTSTVMAALLWQHYGLDLSHPEVSCWLEQNAPDVRYAIAEDRGPDGDDHTELRVRFDGTMKVYLSPEVDRRLREVSYRYLLRQIPCSVEPVKEQIAPELVHAITVQATASGLSVNDYLVRLLAATPRCDGELSLAEVREADETRALAPSELMTN